MEAVRQIIDSSLLNDAISLPKCFKNKKVEVFVFLTEERIELPPLTESDIDKMIEGSVTESLIGVLPHSGMSLEDYQSERLKKYELAD